MPVSFFFPPVVGYNYWPCRERAAEWLFIYWCLAWGCGTAHKKRLSDAEHRAGEQHTPLSLWPMSTFVSETVGTFISPLCGRTTWATSDLVSLTSCLFSVFFPSFHLVCVSLLPSVLSVSPPSPVQLCEPEQGGWLGFFPLRTCMPLCVCVPVCLSLSQWPGLWWGQVALSQLHSVLLTDDTIPPTFTWVNGSSRQQLRFFFWHACFQHAIRPLVCS